MRHLSFPTVLILALTAAPAFAQADLDRMIDQGLPALISTYKQLHAAPELSGHEEKTGDFIAAQLRALGFEVIDHLGKYRTADLTGYGVAGVLKNGAGPVVLFRTELDALPVTEQTGLPYASTVRGKNQVGDDVGVMHACGHDLHMSSFLGTAKVMSSTRERWHGTLVMLAQPAEELGGGADSVLRDGLYQKVPRPDYVVALHDLATLAYGKIGYTPGYAMANVDSVNLTIRGVGGHGATPASTKDPIVIAAQVVLALQTIVSRENYPLDPVVVTVGSIHGGTKHNIIPDEVRMQLTVRTYKPEVRKKVLASIQRIANGIAEAAGVPADRKPLFEVLTGQSGEATYNDPALTERLAAVWQKSLHAENVVKSDPLMVSEDVGQLGLENHQIPLCMFWLGAVDPARVADSEASGIPLPALHSSKFAPVPEPALRTGIKASTVALMELFRH